MAHPHRLHEDSILRPILSALIALLAISYYVTGNLTWGYQTRWTNPRYVRFRLFQGLHNFTEAELAQYDGTDATKPILLAIDGLVFDVSVKPDTYGPIGPYRFFSGHDGARAFGTGCFDSDRTHDLRELDEETLNAIKGWQKFYMNHVKYWHVGYVTHPPLTGSPPPPCNGQKRPS